MGIIEIYFSYFSTETYVVGTQKNHLISFEHPKQMLKLMDKKVFTILCLIYFLFILIYAYALSCSLNSWMLMVILEAQKFF